jgi:hypothetical protein
MSSHPGTTMKDAVDMALWLKRWGYSPEQVQDFYPTPGTVSTTMYYTGIDPLTGKSVYVCTDYKEKQLQRALLQFKKSENANLVREALRMAGREDLIGNGEECLVRHAFGQGDNKRGKGKGAYNSEKSKRGDGKSRSAARPAGARSGGKAKERSAAVAQRPKHFYEDVVSAKAPKRSKMERIFGEEYLRIKREAEAMTREGKRASGAKPESGGRASAQKRKKR